MNKNQGFTLIELLVVVLIIGILSAVALPQYRKAVIKTHVMRLLPLTRSISDAENLYYLANNSYTNDFSELSIDMPSGAETEESSRVTYHDFVCFLNLSTSSGTPVSVYCNSNYSGAPNIEKYFTRKEFICWPQGSDVSKEVCKSISGKTNPDAGRGGSISGYFF